MKEKDRINENDEDFDIEFVEDNETIELEDASDEDIKKDYNDEDSEDEFDLDEIEYNPEEDYVSGEKQKLTKNQIINRIMAGMGIAIGTFTIFYGIVAYGALHKGSEDTEAETTPTTTVDEENPKVQNENEFFVSTNTDENISENVKNLLNDAKLESLRTGNSIIDNKVSEILDLTCKPEMTTYEKVRNIYDYMLYFYDVKTSSYIDDDSIYDFSSSYQYTSFFDMKLMYKANKMMKDKTGDSKDYASAFTILLRKLGLEAYCIEGKMSNETGYDTEGYTVVMLDDEMYIFDVSEDDKLAADGKVEYKVFCKKFDELDDKYSDDGVEESKYAFKAFETLGELSFSAKISTDGGENTSASIGYSSSSNTAEADNIEIDIDESVYLKGNVTGSESNTWKLVARLYDENMNYITESTLYNEDTDTSSNSVTYTPGRSGYVKLIYMVTEENGRTCSISVLVEVNGYEEETTTSGNVASQGELE